MKTNYINLLKLTLIIAAMVAIAVTVIGILATPVVLAIHFSWYWLFLYLGYLFVRKMESSGVKVIIVPVSSASPMTST